MICVYFPTLVPFGCVWSLSCRSEFLEFVAFVFISQSLAMSQINKEVYQFLFLPHLEGGKVSCKQLILAKTKIAMQI